MTGAADFSLIERHASAVAWRELLPVPTVCAWGAGADERALLARALLPAAHGESSREDLVWLRDDRGKPSVRLAGRVARGAKAAGLDPERILVSNTHDGPGHLVLACSSPALAGIGADMVWLPRLRGATYSAAYLRRLARAFMGDAEYRAFLEAAEDEEEPLRRRLARHFSLMESASKALGTGLRLGFGRNRGVPKESISIAGAGQGDALSVTEEALERMAEIRASRLLGWWGEDDDYVVSAVLALRGT